MWRDLAASLRVYLVTGLFGGALVYLVSVVDRVATLWPSFNAWHEPLVFALYLAPILLLGVATGAALGVVLLAVRAVFLGVTWLAGRSPVPARLAPWVAGGATTLVLGLLVRGFLAARPELVENPLFKFVKKIDGKLVSIDFVVANFSWLFLAAIFVAVGALLVADVVLGYRAEWGSRVLRLAGAALFGVASAGAYLLDSRFLYGRYEWTIHIPAAAGALALAFVAAGLARGALATGAEGRRRVAIAATVLVAFALGASAFDLWHVGRNENLKALLWRRDVVARRAYQSAAWLYDRDGDGFSTLFGGGDTNDLDPNVHPLATEIPGNGIDENGVGGDGAVGVSLAAAAAPATVVAPGKNFLFIAIDTLRANRMSAYGYERPTSPRLAEWGARGLFFERAYAQGSNTGQTFATMQRSVTRGALYDEARPTMFRTLRDSGYRTAQVNARRDDTWLDGGMWTDYRRILLDGVERVTHVEGKKLWNADKVTDAAIEYLSSLDGAAPHATWVHYFDPHAPRRKMEPFDWGDSDSDKYDTEVAFADLYVGRLLDWMRETGRLENTIVVLMADHGEAFGDHGMVQHGNRPYDDQIHVPLMIWAPGVAPSRVATPVSTIDIAPTVLAYLGLPAIPEAEGVNLLSGSVPERPIHIETPRNGVDLSFFAYAIHDGSWRLIWDVYGNTTELYDLSRDPLELHNLADAEPARAAAMRATLARWLDATRSVRPLALTADDSEGE